MSWRRSILHDDGNPDIVAEVGGLFLKHCPDKVKAILAAAEKGNAGALRKSATRSTASSLPFTQKEFG